MARWLAPRILAAALALAAAPAGAQPPPGTTPVPAAPEHADAPRPAAPSRDLRRPAPPLLVAARAVRPVTDAEASAVEAALVAWLADAVQGREVRAVDAIARAALLACTEPGCSGGYIAQLGGAAGALATVERAPGRPRPSGRGAGMMVTLRVLDAVSGAPRGETITVPVPPETTFDAALGAIAPALRALLPGPPPSTTLLVAVNVDGATVSVDGTPVGESPLAPIDIEAGRHVVSAALVPYRTAQGIVEAAPGARARIDLDLELDEAQTEALEEAEVTMASEGPAEPASPWYTRWYVLGGAGVLVVGAAVLVVVAVSAGDETGFHGVPVPPIE